MVNLILALSFLILIVYISNRLGVTNALIALLLMFLVILGIIIILLMMCPEDLKNYMFFKGELHTLFTSIPNEIMEIMKEKAFNSPYIKSLDASLFDYFKDTEMSNYANSKQQTEILNSINTNLEKANIIGEVQLEQFAKGTDLELKHLASIKNTIDFQTKTLQLSINKPTAVIDQLQSINYSLKPNLQILGELKNLNLKADQETRMLVEGFGQLLKSDNKMDFFKEIKSTEASLRNTLIGKQQETIGLLKSMLESSLQEQARLKDIFEIGMKDSLAQIDLAKEEAEQRIQAAEDMTNSYRKHENLGTFSPIPKPNITNPPINPTDAAAGAGLLAGARWLLKFIRII